MANNDIRTTLLNSKSNFKSKNVEVEGVEVEVRQPSMKRRRDMQKSATDDNGEFDSTKFLVYAVIYFTFYPGTNDLVFSPDDFDKLMEQPAGGWVDQIGEQASELINSEQGKEESES